MEKITIEKKNKAIIERFRENFRNMKKENLSIIEIRNELILRIQQKTGKSKKEILEEINSFIESKD